MKLESNIGSFCLKQKKKLNEKLENCCFELKIFMMYLVFKKMIKTGNYVGSLLAKCIMMIKLQIKTSKY
jgi:hypothetical protein